MLSKDFKEFVELLNSNRVEFLVVGGYALAAHGHPRYTGDIDVWYRPTTANVSKLLQVLEAFGFGDVGITAEDLSTPGAVIQLGYAPARIDLLSSIDGVEFSECYGRRIDVTVMGLTLPVISVSDLRTNKLTVGRPQDIADVAALDE